MQTTVVSFSSSTNVRHNKKHDPVIQRAKTKRKAKKPNVNENIAVYSTTIHLFDGGGGDGDGGDGVGCSASGPFDYNNNNNSRRCPLSTVLLINSCSMQRALQYTVSTETIREL